MIITYTTAYVRSLSSFGANVVEIFEVVERWVVVDVWVGVSIPFSRRSALLGWQLG